MQTLPTQGLAQACRIFLTLAYPRGSTTIPANKLPYYEMLLDEAIDSFLPPAKVAVGVCQDLSKTKAGIPGFEFRLGSEHFPHLKLRIQIMDLHQRAVWVYSVDTHDHFHKATDGLSPEEAEAWRQIIEQNRTLKQAIETALAAAGLVTPTSLLKLDLTLSSSS